MPQNVTWNGVTYPIPLAGELNWASLSNFLIDLGTFAAVAEEAKQTVRVAVSTPVTVAAASDYAVITDLTVPGAVAVNLPAGVAGQIFIIVDGKGDAVTNNITITPNGAETIGGASTVVLDKNRQSVIIGYDLGTTDWKLLEYSIPIGGVTPADFSGVVPPEKGGTGVANDPSATLTRNGAFNLNINTSGVRTLDLGGNVVFDGPFHLIGANLLNLTTTAATSVTLPTSGTLATLDGIEALTNKTLDVTDVITGATAASFTNGGTVILPTSGTLATLSGVEVFTNKDVDGGTASNTSRITLPSDTLANLTALTRKAGTEVYATDTQLVYYDDGTSLIPLSSASLVSQGAPGLVASAGQLLGTNTNDDAGAGYVGEEIINAIASSSAVPLSSGIVSDVLAVSLTAGDWDVSADIGVTVSSATISSYMGAVSISAVTFPSSDTRFVSDGSQKSCPGLYQVGSNDFVSLITTYRVSLATTTTLYGLALVSFPLGSVFGFGTLRARRIR